MRKGLVLLVALVISSATNAADQHRLLIHRIGPSAATFYMARADGSEQRAILAQSALDYNASPSPDGRWILFTSERGGSADIYRVRTDGSSLERLTEDPAYDDQASWSPDGTKIAFVSSRGSGTTDIWTLDLRTKAIRNVTVVQGGDFRPSWSPDGRWITFSSDRGTEIERDLPEWEHLQRTSIYVVHPDGSGLRRLTHGEHFAGSPKWSADAKRVVFYELDVIDTHKVRGGRQSQVNSQIVSIDLEKGIRHEHTSGPGLKVSPQFLAGDRIGYLLKAGPNPGIAYTTGERGALGDVRSPAWSSDGGSVVYSRGLSGTGRRNYSALQSLFSGNTAFHLRHLQSLAAFSYDGRRLAISERTGEMNTDFAIIVMNTDGTSRQQVFYEKGRAAMGPQWSHDGTWMVFGLGGGFETRNTPARIMLMKPDGSEARTLTTGPGAGFPSLSPDGTRLVFRVWGPAPEDRGLRILTLDGGTITRLTDSEYDTFPGWSPKGDVIAFSSWRNGDYDIYTIRPDGTGLKQLTTTKGNDAHSSWSPDGEFLMFSSSRFGFKDEAPLYDGQPQPYGEIFVMKADGSDQRQLTDNQWEDGPGAWEPGQKNQSSNERAPLDRVRR
jgi:TolB protein